MGNQCSCFAMAVENRIHRPNVQVIALRSTRLIDETSFGFLLSRVLPAGAFAAESEPSGTATVGMSSVDVAADVVRNATAGARHGRSGVSVSACPFAMPVMTRVSAEPACCVSSKSAAVGPSPDLTVRPCAASPLPPPSAARRARSACSRFTCASAASSRRLVFLSSRSDLSVYAMSLTHFPLIVSYICLRYPYSTAAGQ